MADRTDRGKSACVAFPRRLCVPAENRDMSADRNNLPVARRAAGAPRTGLIVRLALLAVAGLLAGVFGVARWINPYDPDGTPRTMSTHTQLGMDPCGFLLATGRPCPACGMTTSFALLVRGDVGASLRANWAGTLIALVWGGVLVWALASAARGRPLLVPRGRGELALTCTVGVVLAVMLTRWGVVLAGGQ